MSKENRRTRKKNTVHFIRFEYTFELFVMNRKNKIQNKIEYSSDVKLSKKRIDH